jgi:hypothetical protein
MTITMIQSFLGLMAIINLALYFTALMVFKLADGVGFKMTVNIFSLTKRQYDGAMFGVLSIYKTLIVFFNIAPYFALMAL